MSTKGDVPYLEPEDIRQAVQYAARLPGLLVIMVRGNNMTSTKKSTTTTKKTSKKQNIFNIITPDDAFVILQTLAKEDKHIAKRIEQLVLEYLSDVDLEGVTDEVYSALDLIDVHDLWDNAGSTRDGYVDPTELAWEMFEDALQPFLEEFKKYQRLFMPSEAKYLCMGILQVIYRFSKESNSEFKDWAVDAPGEYFSITLEKWQNACKNSEDLKEMEAFIQENCPKWS